MEIRDFLVFALPFIIIAYFGFLLFIRPTKKVLAASLFGGLVTALVNMLVDFVAYYAHWWHYTLNGLVLHLPLPFYLSSLLFYGSVVYLLIWRFWAGRTRWLARALYLGVPIVGIARDISGWIMNSSYSVWDNTPLAILITIVMWITMFYGGLLVFKALAPLREQPA